MAELERYEASFSRFLEILRYAYRLDVCTR